MTNNLTALAEAVGVLEPDPNQWDKTDMNNQHEDHYNIGDTCCGVCGLGLCYVDQITGEYR